MSAHDCAQQGHVWLEDASNLPYRRHRGRKEASVPCTCQHCMLSANLPGYGAFTAPPGPHPVDHRIPAPFKTVIDRAVAAAAHDPGPAREP